MSGYLPLTNGQRYQIQILVKAGHSQMEIADMIGVHKSTICPELQRNGGFAAIGSGKHTRWH